MVRHPSYDGFLSSAFDIALLVLDKPVQARPAALAPANYKMPIGSGMGEELYAAGWSDYDTESDFYSEWLM